MKPASCTSTSMKLVWCLCCLSLLTLCLAGGRIVEWDLDMAPLMSTPVNDGAFEFLDTKAHSGGYFAIDGTEDGHLFYMYFKNRKHDPDAPLLFWTNGGPGCSSFFGLFLENGPYRIQDDLTLCWDPNGWDTAYNIIFVDHPLDVGFSYGSEADKVKTEEQVAEHILQFFYAFYEKHPETKQKPLFLAGESYAGHYLPAIANRILDANDKGGKMHIHLEGMALGDPWTNPSVQYRSYPVYEYEMGLIDKKTKNNILEYWKFCDSDMKLCDPFDFAKTKAYCEIAYGFCESAMLYPIFELYPTINYYDIRGECLVDGCYNVTNLNAFMNQPQVKKRFRIPEHITWKDCNDDVLFAMYWDMATDTTLSVARLLDKGLPILIYVGDQDLICNHIGNRDWVEAMKWTLAEKWKQTAKEIWLMNGERAGEIQTQGPLTFLKIDQCGHMVPYDQPVVSLEMITTFTDNEKTWTRSSDQKTYIQV